ncbi:NmrA/HSCARG family protein [Staphylococcus aureus]|uniref:NmrA/HSCARG family protein n=1 Tax=Staphylococcus aureus TaxID=1280 RepID=UPI0018EB59EB|nr:NmrA/HSCARG family protein [Staphylococcus aureus]MBJ6164254.1 NmrA/HSCARG family protein [Staphylococcus aureus]MBJ6165020.1 NmrA/HSCARG family protein [Staphylococcus aureus]MBJ6168354.1 NmrA/HSCARG family protein [Staphylococcus aureus]MBJ6179425.1 NmrA/HSCARG family protein [Staphylococcus aureus]MBJ6180959.1 NmrA/HSCARG family protein [Staphylococcus aureus]
MKDILVIGATGKQGNAVVKQLLEDGWYVSALTRNKNNRKLSDIGHPHLSIVEGDLSDNVSLQSAMKGKYGLYSIQPIVKDDVSEELRQGMKIIEIAEQENIQHIVYSTAGGVNRNRTGPHFEVLAKIENRLMESNINATVIKPSFFMDNFLRIAKVEDERITLPEFINPNIKFTMISSIDIAKIASYIFAHPQSFTHQSIEIGSDEVTLSEAATIFSEVTGKSTVIEGEFVSGVAEKQWLEEKGYEVDFELMAEINPTRLSLSDWLKAQNYNK